MSTAEREQAYVFPLSFAQTRLWILDQLAPGSTLYNLRFAVRLRQPVLAAALQQTVNAVVQRHEVLRTVFKTADGAPAQVVLDSMPVRLECFDLRRLPDDRREAEAVRLALELGERPFDLGRGPLLRTRLVWLAPSDYALVVSLHHIVADGWSMGVLASELAGLYEAFAHGREPDGEPLPVQYADFAVWQRESLGGERLERQLEFWRGVLDELPVLSLPLDRPRPALQAHRGAGFGFAVEAAVVERLGRLAREAGATPFMVLLAGFAVVLGRWCGQEEVVVGAPIAGRDRAELEGLIGFFVNTLVLRVDLSGDPSFRELIGRVRELALGAYAHSELPFEKLVEELAPQRDLSRNPLFQVTFQLFESPGSPDAVAAHPGLEIPVTASLFDLRVDLSPAEAGLAGRVEYDTDLFDRVSVEWLIERFRQVLGEAGRDPERSLSSLQLLPASQRRLLEQWNDTGAELPETGVPKAVEARAREAPERPAVSDGEESWTYGELNRRANRLAHRLRELGCARGSVVALCLPRGCRFAAAALAAMKAGAAYLPLDLGYPAPRLAHILADAKPQVVLSADDPPAPLPPGARSLGLDPWPEGPDGDLDVGLRPEDAAYLIYTSGSTGSPKGVLIEHQGLDNLVGWHRSAYGITADDRGSQIASVGFDAAVWELWPYLTAGASVHTCDDTTRADPHTLLHWLAEKQITVSFIPTPLCEPLLAHPWPTGSPLRYLLTGGDTLRRHANPAHPYTLVNHYGPTEHTVVATATAVGASSDSSRLPSIGAPIGNTTCYVVDHTGNLAGPGTPGELWLGGSSLARGYYGDPPLTAARFVANPFHAAPPRLYRTGDLVRWRPDGTLDFLGRLDGQIKIRGYRVEPHEIEAQLAGHPHIDHALVTARPVPGMEEPGLAAYIAPAEGSEEITGEAARRWLQGRLPEPMIPMAYAVLDALPLTQHGKVDYEALPEPEPVRRDGAGPAPAANPTEALLCRLWADALRVDDAGVHDDFFEFGGHSLLAIQLVSRVRDVLSAELPLRALFEGPTPAQIAGLLRGEGAQAERIDRAAAVALRVMALSEEEIDALLAERDLGERTGP